MGQIDLSEVSITDANAQIRAFAADGRDVEVINPDAQTQYRYFDVQCA